MSKRTYTAITGRDQGDRNVDCLPYAAELQTGRNRPAAANKIGYELAMKLTKGNHAFIVCTHVDKAHIHSHIISIPLR
jgi:hypothetical protein